MLRKERDITLDSLLISLLTSISKISDISLCNHFPFTFLPFTIRIPRDLRSMKEKEIMNGNNLYYRQLSLKQE